MPLILRFFAKNTVLTFFLFLQTVSIVLIFTRNFVQHSFVTAHIYAFKASISKYVDSSINYLKLKQVNEDLIAQNKMLMKELYNRNDKTIGKEHTFRDNTIGSEQNYTIIDADVIQNSINRENNYFTISKGKAQGVESKMGIISPQGIAGIVVNTTDNYALVQSVLSTKNIKINASLKATDYFGTLEWRGEDSRIMHLSDIPKYVLVKIGDTIVTGGKSSIFPEGIMIGKVAGYEVDPKTGYWDISVELNQKMGQLQKVFIIKNLKKKELEEMQEILEMTVKEND